MRSRRIDHRNVGSNASLSTVLFRQALSCQIEQFDIDSAWRMCQDDVTTVSKEVNRTPHYEVVRPQTTEGGSFHRSIQPIWTLFYRTIVEWWSQSTQLVPEVPGVVAVPCMVDFRGDLLRFSYISQERRRMGLSSVEIWILRQIWRRYRSVQLSFWRKLENKWLEGGLTFSRLFG